MKNIRYQLSILLFTLLTMPYPGSSQASFANDLQYEVNSVYPYISISRENLKEAQTLADLNRHYKPAWVREYLSVEVLTSYNGKPTKAISKTGTLSQEQKDLLNKADAGKDISVTIQYIPENTLTHKESKEINFTFTVDPDSEAKYPGGQPHLNEYLKEKAISKIPAGTFKNYDLAAIKFIISEEGEVTNVQVFETCKDKVIDELLAETIRTMPCWAPAAYSNGLKVKQEFVLTVGNMENCVINLLNIRQGEE